MSHPRNKEKKLIFAFQNMENTSLNWRLPPMTVKNRNPSHKQYGHKLASLWEGGRGDLWDSRGPGGPQNRGTDFIVGQKGVSDVVIASVCTLLYGMLTKIVRHQVRTA